jgi:hypothetical protein
LAPSLCSPYFFFSQGSRLARVVLVTHTHTQVPSTLHLHHPTRRYSSTTYHSTTALLLLTTRGCTIYGTPFRNLALLPLSLSRPPDRFLSPLPPSFRVSSSLDDFISCTEAQTHATVAPFASPPHARRQPNTLSTLHPPTFATVTPSIYPRSFADSSPLCSIIPLSRGRRPSFLLFDDALAGLDDREFRHLPLGRRPCLTTSTFVSKTHSRSDVIDTFHTQ